MKRIINMGPDVYPGLDPAPKMFAVWCTVCDRFEEINGAQDWASAGELEDDFNYVIEQKRTGFSSAATTSDIEVVKREVEQLEALRDRCVSLARGNGY